VQHSCAAPRDAILRAVEILRDEGLAFGVIGNIAATGGK